MQTSQPSDWGFISQITPSIPTPKRPESPYQPFFGATLKLSNGLTLLLDELLYWQHALIGRGTCVVRAKLKSDDVGHNWHNKKLVVKLTFTPETREAERDILSYIMNKTDFTEHEDWRTQMGFEPSSQSSSSRINCPERQRPPNLAFRTVQNQLRDENIADTALDRAEPYHRTAYHGNALCTNQTPL